MTRSTLYPAKYGTIWYSIMVRSCRVLNINSSTAMGKTLLLSAVGVLCQRQTASPQDRNFQKKGSLNSHDKMSWKRRNVRRTEIQKGSQSRKTSANENQKCDQNPKNPKFSQQKGPKKNPKSSRSPEFSGKNKKFSEQKHEKSPQKCSLLKSDFLACGQLLQKSS